MAGHKRGNQERRANELLQKLNPKDDVAEVGMLTRHIKLVQHAKNLVPKLLPTMDDDSFKKSCMAMQKGGSEVPQQGAAWHLGSIVVYID